jgi:mono/diheme cytochrome c family protein
LRAWREAKYPLVQASLPSKETVLAQGKRLYTQHCATCHGADGRGVPEHFPPLRDDVLLSAPDPWGSIYVTLYGLSGRPVAGREWPARMGGFAQYLTDQEAAALLTYARSQFVLEGREVEAADVARVRREVRRGRSEGVPRR